MKFCKPPSAATSSRPDATLDDGVAQHDIGTKFAHLGRIHGLDRTGGASGHGGRSNRTSGRIVRPNLAVPSVFRGSNFTVILRARFSVRVRARITVRIKPIAFCDRLI